MLDASKLKAPQQNGQVLVAPDPRACVAALAANAKALRAARTPMLDSTLAEWRRRTRENLVGTDAAAVIVIGHQPSFIHPGVWAKHVVAMRLAAAMDGVAMNLVVDSDVVRDAALLVPSVRQKRFALQRVRWTQTPHDAAYEQIPRQTEEQFTDFDKSVRQALGDRYEETQMPTFAAGFRRASEARDWVGQMLSARKAIDAKFGIAISDHRISSMAFLPLLADILLNADRFAACYNNALKWYRSAFRVRGRQRPIPDLHSEAGRLEVPFWIHRTNEPRRRLFVEETGDTLRLFAESESVGQVSAQALRRGEVEHTLGKLGDWRLRPRALTLTLWARLLLADLFIHGIGGAKYDRITDKIISDYYGLEPPQIACVSATLWVDLPGKQASVTTVREWRHRLRDLQCNPQRNLELDSELRSLAARREEAVNRALRLRDVDPNDRSARRAAFEAIRSANQALLAARPGALAERQASIDAALDELGQNRIAHSREYFFGLYSRSGLQQLLDALPDQHRFLV